MWARIKFIFLVLVMPRSWLAEGLRKYFETADRK